MDAAHELAHENWDEYLDAVNRELLDAHVSVELDESGHRREIETELLAFRALTYDRHDDVIELSVARGEPSYRELVRHRVTHPKRVATDSQTLLAPMTIAFDSQDGRRTLIRFERDVESADFS